MIQRFRKTLMKNSSLDLEHKELCDPLMFTALERKKFIKGIMNGLILSIPLWFMIINGIMITIG